MIRITTIKGNVAATAKTYYSKEDNYYNVEATSAWHGTLCKELSLHGEVDNIIFEKLLNGNLPNGKQALVNRRVKSSQRRMAYDFTFSAPKSLSIQGLVANNTKFT